MDAATWVNRLLKSPPTPRVYCIQLLLSIGRSERGSSGSQVLSDLLLIMNMMLLLPQRCDEDTMQAAAANSSSSGGQMAEPEQTEQATDKGGGGLRLRLSQLLPRSPRRRRSSSSSCSCKTSYYSSSSLPQEASEPTIIIPRPRVGRHDALQLLLTLEFGAVSNSLPAASSCERPRLLSQYM